ncbi:hypothetical protein E4P41_03450 [Geodermatophilus sp. DF01-2]|uniref:hypothetical protein n=1 Tax=Geodermatophilus sp. DF01-2 TaxID=2559610 RepID=UPI0010738639|nr:hypothetical protein [Geodermatophilus sp. DF01_2]TFV63788.1 hypothetical protein E4P41_03450 [Geodermatophilus sp. DF01_2]
MGRWLVPLMGVVGLLTLVVGVVWAEFDRGSMGGVGVVGYGALLLVVAAAAAVAVEAQGRRRPTSPRR